MPQSRCWVGGIVRHTSYTSRLATVTRRLLQEDGQPKGKQTTHNTQVICMLYSIIDPINEMVERNWKGRGIL